MTSFKNLLSLLLLCAGLVAVGPAVIGAQDDIGDGEEGGDCIKAEYVEDDKCQGALKEMCKGPKECWPDAS